MCFAEEENSYDRKAVAVTCTEEYVVGHLPSEISGFWFNFIKHGGKMNGEITGWCCVRGLALAKIRGFTELQSWPTNRFFKACRGKIAASLQTLDF